MYWPETLRAESQAEVYVYIDKYYKKLPKIDGRITGIGNEFLDNDVDALRHSYTSGVFTQEYGEALADLFGQGHYPRYEIRIIKGENTPVSKKDKIIPNLG